MAGPGRGAAQSLGVADTQDILKTEVEGVELLRENEALIPSGRPAADPSPSTPAEASAPPAAKAVVRRFFDSLEEAGVSYCHWKSNIRLADTLAGREDIDVLVDPCCAAAFQSTLLKCGYKPAVSRSGVGHPAVFHAIALDSDTWELVDLHAYYQIVSGDSLVKNYRFPIERALLQSACCQDGVRVPDPAAELALFVLRIALKHASPVEVLKVNRHYEKVVAELAWLSARCDAWQAAALMAAWFPSIEPALFDRLRQAIAGGALARRVVLGWKVAWRLRHLRRLGPLRATASRYRRLLLLVIGRVRRRRDLMLQSGGAVIAVVGPKGTGKSTIGGHLAERLGRYLHVRRIHAGKPPATLVSALPRLFVPLGRLLLPQERLRVYQSEERRQTRHYSMLYVLRMLLVAYDRRRLLLRALRQATAGAVVISDRYPSETARAIDSSCFDDRAIAQCPRGIKRWMMRRERALYRNLPRPSLVLQLDTQLETALERDAQRRKRGGPDPEAVRLRWLLESRSDFPHSPSVRIDTGRPLDETLRLAVQAVWRNL